MTTPPNDPRYFDCLDRAFQDPPEELKFNNCVVDFTDRYTTEASYLSALTGHTFTAYEIKLHKGRLPLEPPSEYHDTTHDHMFSMMKPVDKVIATRQNDWNRILKLCRYSEYKAEKTWRLQGRLGTPKGL